MADNPLKIVLFCRSLNRGGAERQIIYLAKGLQEAGHKVTILTLYPPSPSWYETSGLKIVDLKKKSRWDLAGFIKSYIWFLKSEQPDVLYSFLTVQNIIAALTSIFTKTKVVCGVRTSFMDLSQYTWLDRVLQHVENQAFRLNVKIICNSYAGQEHVLNNAPYAKNKISVVTNGLDFTTNQFSLEKRQELRKKLSIKDQDILIGHVGRYDPMKDHQTFIDAAAAVKEKIPNSHFLCWGHGDPTYTQHLKDYAVSKNVTIIWHYEDGDPCYSAFDVYCCSSLGEGYSNTLAEAMAHGIPSVTTDVGDCRHIVGEHGLAVAPKTPDDLAEAIIKTLNKGIRIPDQEQIKYSQSKFSNDNLTNETLLKIS